MRKSKHGYLSDERRVDQSVVRKQQISYGEFTTTIIVEFNGVKRCFIPDSNYIIRIL